MTTKSGQAVRRAMLSRFRLYTRDFGDTKLFDAAVLPSVLLARGTPGLQHLQTNEIAYSSIYETSDAAITEAEDVLSALTADSDTVIAIPDGRHSEFVMGYWTMTVTPKAFGVLLPGHGSMVGNR